MKLIAVLFKWALILIALFIVIFMLTCTILYRIPASSEDVTFEGEILFKFVDLDFTERGLYEEVVQNSRIRLVGGQKLFVNKEARAALWPENPHEMAKKNYKLQVVLKARLLYFGGYSTATVVSIKKVEGKPYIRK